MNCDFFGTVYSCEEKKVPNWFVENDWSIAWLFFSMFAECFDAPENMLVYDDGWAQRSFGNSFLIQNSERACSVF